MNDHSLDAWAPEPVIDAWYVVRYAVKLAGGGMRHYTEQVSYIRGDTLEWVPLFQSKP